MKEFKEQIVSAMIEANKTQKIVYLRNVAGTLGYNHVTRKDCEDIAKRLKNSGFRVVTIDKDSNKSLFCSIAVVDKDISFEDE